MWASLCFEESPMLAESIRVQIQNAWNEEQRRDTFAALIRSQLARRAEASGESSSPQDRERAARSILESWRVQLEQVPELIDALAEAAADARVDSVVGPILETIQEYFLDADDVIPDSHGILGLLDDMYLALSLLQSVSEQYRELTGHALIDIDLAPSIQAVQPLFQGKRIAALDARIRAALCQPAMVSSLQGLRSLDQPLAVKNREPEGRHVADTMRTHISIDNLRRTSVDAARVR
jgi:uncharacterized membrane protein YkvA (DUF1232 family)